MVIIVFLIDTSASMNQKTAHGTSYLDLAKNGILTFVKVGECFWGNQSCNSLVTDALNCLEYASVEMQN